MLRRSPLQNMMDRNAETMFPGDTHLLGDCAYPLRKNLLVPFRNNGRLIKNEEKFNGRLSAARSSIERCYALMKGRFRKLKYIDMSDMSQVPRVIIACCILHNICIHYDDDTDVSLNQMTK